MGLCAWHGMVWVEFSCGSLSLSVTMTGQGDDVEQCARPDQCDLEDNLGIYSI